MNVLTAVVTSAAVVAATSSTRTTTSSCSSSRRHLVHGDLRQHGRSPTDLAGGGLIGGAAVSVPTAHRRRRDHRLGRRRRDRQRRRERPGHQRQPCDERSGAVAIGGIAGAAVNASTASITAAAVTLAEVKAAAVVSAPGDPVTVQATSTNRATSQTLAIGAGIGAAVAVQVTVAEVAAPTRARFDGDILSTPTKTAGLLVQAQAGNQAVAETKVLTVSAGLSGTGVSSTALVSGEMLAVLGSTASVNVSGAVTVKALLSTFSGEQNLARSTLQGLAGGGIAAGIVVIDATVSGSVRALVNGAITGSGSVTIDADATMKAIADSFFIAVGLGALVGIATTATVSADTIAGGDDAGSVAATSGAFTVTADSTYDATSNSNAPTVGAVAVTVQLPRAAVNGRTGATYAGQVTGGTLRLGDCQLPQHSPRRRLRDHQHRVRSERRRRVRQGRGRRDDRRRARGRDRLGRRHRRRDLGRRRHRERRRRRRRHAGRAAAAAGGSLAGEHARLCRQRQDGLGQLAHDHGHGDSRRRDRCEDGRSRRPRQHPGHQPGVASRGHHRGLHRRRRDRDPRLGCDHDDRDPHGRVHGYRDAHHGRADQHLVRATSRRTPPDSSPRTSTTAPTFRRDRSR